MMSQGRPSSSQASSAARIAADTVCPGKIGEQIDIAVGTHRAARRGTEQPVAAAILRRR